MEISAAGDVLHYKTYDSDHLDQGYVVYNRNDDYLLLGLSQHDETNIFGFSRTISTAKWLKLNDNGDAQ